MNPIEIIKIQLTHGDSVKARVYRLMLNGGKFQTIDLVQQLNVGKGNARQAILQLKELGFIRRTFKRVETNYKIAYEINTQTESRTFPLVHGIASRAGM